MTPRWFQRLCGQWGHNWEYGWQGNGNMDRRECRRCHVVQRGMLRCPEGPEHRFRQLGPRLIRCYRCGFERPLAAISPAGGGPAQTGTGDVRPVVPPPPALPADHTEGREP